MGATKQLGVTNIISTLVVPSPEIALPPDNLFRNSKTKTITVPTAKFEFVN